MSFQDLMKVPVFQAFGRPKKIADVGIEIEVEGFDLPESVPHWQAKPEGSLQGGIEYITKPIKAEVVKTYVDGLKKYISDNGGIIKPSYRCSTHIHVNVLPDNVEDMLGFITVFTMFEPLLLSMCGPQRDGNLFCMSSYDTGDVIHSFEHMCKILDRLQTHGWSYERGKYSAFNTGRLADLGTLEARCFPLSVDGAEVSKWVGWFLKIRDMAKSQPDKTYRELWKNVRQNPTWYATSIFGMEIHSQPQVYNLVDLGTETAYEMTKILKKWHNMPAKTAKEPKKAGLKKGFINVDPVSWQDFTLAQASVQPFGGFGTSFAGQATQGTDDIVIPSSDVEF